MIRSVLIAGMHDDRNQYTKYVEDLWLRYEHLPEIKNNHIPVKHDAVIVAAAQASHTLYHAVKQAYSAAGKPVFLSKVGISEIKEDFEETVFGGEETLRKLREPAPSGSRSTTCLSITTRFWWVLAHFKEPGDKVKMQDVIKFFEKFLIKGEDKAIQQAWYRGRHDYCLDDVSPGIAIFKGIPEKAYEALQLLKIECDSSIVIKDPFKAAPAIIRPDAKPLPKHTPEQLRFEDAEKDIRELNDSLIVEKVEMQKIGEDFAMEFMKSLRSTEKQEKDATMDLLLESMSAQMADMKALKDMLETRIPEIIKKEIKGITIMLGGIVPKLQDLSPEKLAKINTMIDLMLD